MELGGYFSVGQGGVGVSTSTLKSEGRQIFEICDFEDPVRFFSKSPSQTPEARFQSLHTTN